MKAFITIHLDDGEGITLTLDHAIELRDKLNRLAPRKEWYPWDECKQEKMWAKPHPVDPISWPPEAILCY